MGEERPSKQPGKHQPARRHQPGKHSASDGGDSPGNPNRWSPADRKPSGQLLIIGAAIILAVAGGAIYAIT